MISCNKGDVKIEGESSEYIAETTILMRNFYQKLVKERGEEEAGKCLVRIMRRAKMSSEDVFIDVVYGISGMLAQVIGIKSNTAKRFEPGKTYVFDAKLCRNDLSIMGMHASVSDVWVNSCDGKVVDVKNSIVGIIDDYRISPDWCREVE